MARRNQGAKLRWLEERGVFYICWTVNGRSRKLSTGTADRQEAEILRAEWVLKNSKPTGPRDPSQVLVTDALNEYALARGPKVVGKETMANGIEHLARLWEGKTVAEIPSYIDAYIKKRDRAVGTVRRELGLLQAAVNHEHKKGRLSRSVVVELPPAPPSKERWLARQEAAKLIRAARKDPKARLYMPLFVLIGLYTGRRKEAILSLRWPQVDLKAGLLDFEIEGRVRTKKQRGKVPIPDRLLPHLVRARRRGSDLGPVMHISGRPIANIKKGFAAACKRAGIEGVTPHTLRHTAASWLMQSGTPTIEIAKYLGMSERTLIATYGHHQPDWLRGAANAIGSRRGIGA